MIVMLTYLVDACSLIDTESSLLILMESCLEYLTLVIPQYNHLHRNLTAQGLCVFEDKSWYIFNLLPLQSKVTIQLNYRQLI